jgi:hypothetical protein
MDTACLQAVQAVQPRAVQVGRAKEGRKGSLQERNEHATGYRMVAAHVAAAGGDHGSRRQYRRLT